MATCWNPLFKYCNFWKFSLEICDFSTFFSQIYFCMSHIGLLLLFFPPSGKNRPWTPIRTCPLCFLILWWPWWTCDTLLAYVALLWQNEHGESVLVIAQLILNIPFANPDLRMPIPYHASFHPLDSIHWNWNIFQAEILRITETF